MFKPRLVDDDFDEVLGQFLALRRLAANAAGVSIEASYETSVAAPDEQPPLFHDAAPAQPLDSVGDATPQHGASVGDAAPLFFISRGHLTDLPPFDFSAIKGGLWFE